MAASRRALVRRATRRPRFIFVKLIEAHSPYDSSRQFRDRFVSDASLDITGNRWPEYYLGKKTFSAAELRHLNELYDAEVLYVDSLVGRMIAALQAPGLRDETVTSVTSDHGENIGDHGHVDHVASLYEATILTPRTVH